MIFLLFQNINACSKLFQTLDARRNCIRITTISTGSTLGIWFFVSWYPGTFFLGCLGYPRYSCTQHAPSARQFIFIIEFSWYYNHTLHGCRTDICHTITARSINIITVTLILIVIIIPPDFTPATWLVLEALWEFLGRIPIQDSRYLGTLTRYPGWVPGYPGIQGSFLVKF